jgi:hypothetical protein
LRPRSDASIQFERSIVEVGPRHRDPHFLLQRSAAHT